MISFLKQEVSVLRTGNWPAVCEEQHLGPGGGGGGVPAQGRRHLQLPHHPHQDSRGDQQQQYSVVEAVVAHHSNREISLLTAGDLTYKCRCVLDILWEHLASQCVNKLVNYSHYVTQLTDSLPTRPIHQWFHPIYKRLWSSCPHVVASFLKPIGLVKYCYVWFLFLLSVSMNRAKLKDLRSWYFNLQLQGLFEIMY